MRRILVLFSDFEHGFNGIAQVNRNSMATPKELAHLQIPLIDILRATNFFADKNLIGQGGFGKVYKGNLLWSGQQIHIAARRLHHDYGQGYIEFLTEISMLSTLNHKNLVSIVGFCYENNEHIIINKHEAYGSLDKYLSNPALSWIQRLHICVGVARALSYIHYDVGRDFSVIHRNIKSSKVLLNDNLEPKISGFELSMKNTTARRHALLLTQVSGTIGYVDPIYERTGGVTYKSDVYSFGVLLFEVLCGRKAFIVDEQESCFAAPLITMKRLGHLHIPNEWSLAHLAKLHYDKRKLENIINPGLWKQMDPQSFSVFSETAYYCLKEQRAQRPNIDQILIRLEKALEFQSKHENPETSSSTTEVTSSDRWKVKNLEHLKFQLDDIISATENFAERCCIGSGGYGMVYKAELEHLDCRSSSSIEGKNNCELPKRRDTVAIKRIFNRADSQGEQGFIAEIEMLSSCKHPNVVSLLGFCDEDPYQILVYEYASNGSLDDYLGRSDNVTNLTWVQRIKICLDIAHGLDYIHRTMVDKQKIIHRDMKSANILLGENWEAKIADFGLSRFHPANQEASTINTDVVVGTEVYWDPEYEKTGRLKKESDIYSFGVVLFEILSGTLAYDQVYMEENEKGLAPVVRRRYIEGTLKAMIDPKLKEETDDNKFTLSKGPNQNSLDTFLEIAHQCLAENQADRPTMKAIINDLENALYFQENPKDILQIPLEDIKLATQNFSRNNLIGRGVFGKLYKGEVSRANGRTTVVVKQMHKKLNQGDHKFMTELEILLEYKHESIIGLVGYCNEMDEKILVFENASKGNLNRYLNNVNLTWMKRLKICIDVASGINFLHGGVVPQDVVIHRGIQSTCILLDEDWKAKLSDFAISLICPISQETDYVINDVVGTLGHCDSLYWNTGILTKESDIYSLGVVLFEILCGRLMIVNDDHGNTRNLTYSVKHHCEKGTIDEIVFKGIKEHIVTHSLITFQRIAYQCLHPEREKRPTASEVVIQLQKALEFQEDREIWESKLPKDYNQIFQKSSSSENYFTKNKKDLYNMLSKGILLEEGKVWFSVGDTGERSEMISARKFSYKNRKSHKWRRVLESRFEKVAEMLDISNLKIKIKIKAQFLSPDVIYGVNLVFKFCDTRKYSKKPMYVNLKYKKGSENLSAYFATWRDKEWMMIELFRFSNKNDDTDFEFLLESFSRYYCGSGAIYVEGIEFQVIEKVKHEEIEKLKEAQEVMKSKSNMDHVQQLSSDLGEMFKRSNDYGKGEKLFAGSIVNGKKHLMVSVKAVLNDFSKMKLLNSKTSSLSGFEEVIEFPPQQVLHMKCKIGSKLLSPDTDYTCYLVFKLSEKCRRLHCPVKVRDLFHRKKKEPEILYFRFPSSSNLHDNNQVPKHREDGWMEINMWKCNSNYKLKNNWFPVNLKLITYEGTLSGLIVYGLEFRPM